MPQTKVGWTSNNASSQFKLWRKEVERIIGGPLAARSDRMKLSHIYIWAGAHAESLIEARLNEDPELRINTPSSLLDPLAACLTHSTYLREQREKFYSIHQNNIRKVGKILQPIFPESWRYIVKPNFPTTLTFLFWISLFMAVKAKNVNANSWQTERM